MCMGETTRNKNRSRSGKSFQSIFKEGRIPKKIQTDHGKEFYNFSIIHLFEKNNIELFSSHSDHKAAVVERFNRTLKMRMSKLFDATQTFRYINHLQDLVKNYNSSYHSSIKMTPIEAFINPDKAFFNLYPLEKEKERCQKL
jgi:hypothetical protein